MLINRLFSKLLILFFLSLIIITSCIEKSPKSNASIKLKIKNNDNETIFLKKILLDGNALIDSAKVDNQGEVIFNVYIDDFDFFLLTDRQSKPIMVLVEKGEDAVLYTESQDFGKHYTVTGSPGSDLINQLNQKKTMLINKTDSLSRVWMKKRYSENRVEIKDALDSIADKNLKAHKKELINFIDRYSSSPAIILAAYQEIFSGHPVFTYEDDFHVFEKVSNYLEDVYPDNIHVKDFKDRTEQYKLEYQQRIKREAKLKPGMPSPEISLFNIDGVRVNLNDFKGNIVLIYFWDPRKTKSWEYNQKLSSIYNQYKFRGFEIIGIHTGENNQLYYNAIKIDNLQWVHLFGNTFVEREWNVMEAPNLILIDREGNIIERNITLEKLKEHLFRMIPPVPEQDSVDTLIINDQSTNDI